MLSIKKPPQKNDNTAFWDALRGRIYTKKGGWLIGKAVYNHGYSMMDDLVGHASFFQVLVLNTTGNLPERRLADWLEALFNCLSWPDSRIWCNQIGSLAGTLQTSPTSAISAGVLAADSRMYGPGVLLAGCDFIKRALNQKQHGSSVLEIIENSAKHHNDQPPIIPGYVRPIARGDERVEAMERVTNSLGYTRGAHLNLAFDIQDQLIEHYKESMNLLGYCVAFLLDQELHPKEIQRILSGWVNSGVHACYAEAADNPPESFFPLQCSDVEYQGHPLRPIPR